MDTPIRSAEELVHVAMVEEGLIDKIKTDPVKELQKLAARVVKEHKQPVYTEDCWVYRIVVGSLGGVVLAAVLGSVVLALVSSGTKPVPEILTALGSAAVGALAGLLAPSPISRG
jgi:hypothetical protein